MINRGIGPNIGFMG
jgi:hypothetical protein